MAWHTVPRRSSSGAPGVAGTAPALPSLGSPKGSTPPALSVAAIAAYEVTPRTSIWHSSGTQSGAAFAHQCARLPSMTRPLKNHAI